MTKDESSIKAKPKILGGNLKLEKRNITSLSEIICWYTDTELEKIEWLELEGNNISSLEGLDKFTGAHMIFLNNNKFTDLSDNDIQILNETNFDERGDSGLTIMLNGNKFNSFDWVKKIDTDKMFNAYNGKLKGRDANNNWVYEKKYDSVFFQIRYDEGTTNVQFLRRHPKSGSNENNKPAPKEPTQTANKPGNCFIATATMGSYDNPKVKQLRQFRDEWILQKSWGESFVKWYYIYGAKAAKVIEKSYVLKKISYLLIVKPLVYLSSKLKQQ